MVDVFENVFVLCCGAASLLLLQEEDKLREKKKKRQWVRDWIRRRDTEGCCSKLLKELRSETPTLYRNFLRMGAAYFDNLLNLVAPLISKKTTHLRKPIAAADRLALTLRFLATGESFRSLQYLFRIPHNTISVIVPEVCDAIFKVLQPEYLNIPSSEEDWKTVADDFLQLWNFPNCIGAVDGKHIVITAPANSGSIFYNYKGTHSIVLMAISDARYKFVYIDVGTNGRVSDGGVFRKTSFYNALLNNKLSLPSPTPLPSRNVPVPYTLVGDDAFALNNNLLKPFSLRNLNCLQRIFNYRLSRARRVVENAFGILSARFRVLRSFINLEPAKARKVTSACCALHNYLMVRKSEVYFSSTLVDHYTEDGRLIPGKWRNSQSDSTLLNLLPHRSYIAPNTAAIREEYSQYFTQEGEVSFQYHHI